jgi:hypothetical protein
MHLILQSSVAYDWFDLELAYTSAESTFLFRARTRTTACRTEPWTTGTRLVDVCSVRFPCLRTASCSSPECGFLCDVEDDVAS